MPDRTLIEGVALELEPVEVEVEDQVPLEEARGFVRELATPIVGVDSEPAEAGDPIPLVDRGESHLSGARPFVIVRPLDHEAARLLRRFLRALHFLEDALTVTRA